MERVVVVERSNDVCRFGRWKPLLLPEPFTVVSLLYTAQVLQAIEHSLEGRGVIVVVKATVSAKYVTLWSPQPNDMGDGLTNVTRFREEVITFNPNRHAPPGFSERHRSILR
jgi:hypothetical protein